MLRHTGQKRNFNHDLRLAILLSLNAGFINAAGFEAFQVLTTNVTGHAALLAINIASMNWRLVRMAISWLLLFLSGAFTTGLIISKIGSFRPLAYTIPIIIIMCLISFVGAFGTNYTHLLYQTEYFAGSLLFAMGMQNALVSVISGSVVRTTHLTGMFTDLGTDIATMITSPKRLEESSKKRELIKNKIVLRLTIILSFLIGGILGGISFLKAGFSCFFAPVFLLLVVLFYDQFRVKSRRFLQKARKEQK